MSECRNKEWIESMKRGFGGAKKGVKRGQEKRKKGTKRLSTIKKKGRKGKGKGVDEERKEEKEE